MSVTIDCYPNETKSFDALPQDSPLQHLDYGGMLTMISNHVQQERTKHRIERLEFLIKKINNVNLDVTVNKIKEEAKCLKSYVPKEWNKGSQTKKKFLKFFESHDIPLQYLEDMYDIQSKGLPVVKKNSLIKIKGNYYTDAAYGVVVEVIDKNTVKYLHVNKNLLPITTKWNGAYMPYLNGAMNVWKCEVIGKFSSFNWEAYNHAIRKNNRDIKCREEFWENHPVLNTLNKPHGFYNRYFDIMNGELPTRIWPQQKPTWNIFEGCIKKAKKDRWIYFCKVRKISLIEENPNISENVLLPLISSEWKNMSNDDRNEYYKHI